MCLAFVLVIRVPKMFRNSRCRREPLRARFTPEAVFSFNAARFRNHFYFLNFPAYVDIVVVVE